MKVIKQLTVVNILISKMNTSHKNEFVVYGTGGPFDLYRQNSMSSGEIKGIVRRHWIIVVIAGAFCDRKLRKTVVEVANAGCFFVFLGDCLVVFEQTT